MTEHSEVKPFREYDFLVKRLISRGMQVKDPLRAQRKLAQVGYYRLSGYWYTSRKFNYVDGKPIYKDEFKQSTSFEDVFDFYLFDKNLRIEFTDALERIEIYFRTIIAHEMGRHDPLSYLDKKQFSKSAFKPDAKISYSGWLERHNHLVEISKEESIKSHVSIGKAIPLWVAAEVWDFGALSKFYSMLTGKNQDLICGRIGIDNRKVLNNWLINLNGIRNRCAHHSRLCNRSNPRDIAVPQKGYFNLLNLSSLGKSKLYGMIAVMWFLLKSIGPNSQWIRRIADIIDSKPTIPGVTYKSMGFSEDEFPRKLFPESIVENDKQKNVSEDMLDGLSKCHSRLNMHIEHLKGVELSALDKETLKSISEKLLDSSCEVEGL